MDFWLLLDWELEDFFNVGGRGLEKLSIMNQNKIVIYNLTKGLFTVSSKWWDAIVIQTRLGFSTLKYALRHLPLFA